MSGDRSDSVGEDSMGENGERDPGIYVNEGDDNNRQMGRLWDVVQAVAVLAGPGMRLRGLLTNRENAGELARQLARGIQRRCEQEPNTTVVDVMTVSDVASSVAGGPTEEQFRVIDEWHKIRRDFTRSRFGSGSERVAKFGRLNAYPRMLKCKHADAAWTVGVLAVPRIGPVAVLEDRNMLHTLFTAPANVASNPGLAYFFASCFGEPNKSFEMVAISAGFGYAPAQAWLSQNALIGHEEAFKWAKLSADQHDPDGLYAMAHMHLNGSDPAIRDHLKGTVYMMNAARAGHPSAQCVRARTLSLTDPEKMVWFHRAALGGSFSHHFATAIVQIVRQFSWVAGTGPRRAIFTLGKLFHLDNVIDYDEKTMYARMNGQTGVPDCNSHQDLFVCATEAVCLFSHWSRKTHEAVNAWVIVAWRLNEEMREQRRKEGKKAVSYAFIPREIRRIIAEMVWAGRVDGPYDAAKLPRDRDTPKRMRLDDGFI